MENPWENVTSETSLDWQQVTTNISQLNCSSLVLKTFHYKNDYKYKSFSLFFMKNSRHKHAKRLPSDLTPWTPTLKREKTLLNKTSESIQ